MTKKIPSYLKLHVETAADEPARPPAANDAWNGLCQALETATGWTLRFDQQPPDAQGVAWTAPVVLPDGKNVGHVAVATPSRDAALPADAARSTVDLAQIEPLALALGRMKAETDQLRRAVREREADLAAGVPVVVRGGEEKHLATRLESVLKGGAEAVGCDGAALYLLDDATSELKMRAVWGLPEERLLAPPRPLQGALADLEALVGHAVVLEDARRMPHWQAPEDCAAAVCVPVSTPTVPLGTLWLFSRTPRPFSDEQTNLVEIVAGRIATDLEREVLLGESLRTRRMEKHFDALSQKASRRAPRIAPSLDDWRVAAWSGPDDGLGGEFYDWNLLHDGALSVAVGSAPLPPLEAALAVATLQAAVRSHTAYPHDPAELHRRVNQTLWTGSAGDQLASLFYARIDCKKGRLDYSACGRPLVLLAKGKLLERLECEAPPLGEQSDFEPRQFASKIAAGQMLLVLSEGARKALERGRIENAELASVVRAARGGGAQQVVERLRELLERSHMLQPADFTILAVEHRTRA
ncbi:MAG: SpoIIE family protein phosphatase [Pirellulaceae bacterium]